MHLLWKTAGIPVERKLPDRFSDYPLDSLINKEIDVYPEYTGTGLVSHLGMDPIYDPEECYETVKKEYEDQFQITWLDHSNVNDSEGLVVSKSAAEQYNLTTISDVWANASNLTLAGNGEFLKLLPLIPD